MITTAIERLQQLVNTVPAQLFAISEAEINYKPVADKWSKKEIVGHLIDSAANNHQRFIRIQYEQIPKIVYDQNKWNSLSHYNEMDREHVIHFWTIYNQHLVNLVKNIPKENLLLKGDTGGDNNVTLEWLIVDYVAHLEHHLEQILRG